MTDRLKGVWVAFDHDIREDDAEPIIGAIRCLKGVAGVDPCLAKGSGERMNRERMNRQQIRTEIAEKFFALYRELLGIGD